MMSSRMRLEIRSQHNSKFDSEASTLGAPPHPREARRPPRVELSSCLPVAFIHNKLPLRRIFLPVAVGDLCCRALDRRNVYILGTVVVMNGP